MDTPSTGRSFAIFIFIKVGYFLRTFKILCTRFDLDNNQFSEVVYVKSMFSFRDKKLCICVLVWLNIRNSKSKSC